MFERHTTKNFPYPGPRFAQLSVVWILLKDFEVDTMITLPPVTTPVKCHFIRGFEEFLGGFLNFSAGVSNSLLGFMFFAKFNSHVESMIRRASGTTCNDRRALL